MCLRMGLGCKRIFMNLEPEGCVLWLQKCYFLPHWGELIALHWIPYLDIRGHFEAEKREKEEEWKQRKGQKEYEKIILEINFWLRPWLQVSKHFKLLICTEVIYTQVSNGTGTRPPYSMKLLVAPVRTASLVIGAADTNTSCCIQTYTEY